MTQEEFKALKPGDKVRIVKEKKGGDWNQGGKMDKWLGQVMTVRENECFGIRMEEDKNDQTDSLDSLGWYWDPEMIECKVPKFKKGDRVRMKPYEEILAMAGKTEEEAEKEGRVKLPSGLWFYDNMSRCCGKEYRVKSVDDFLNRIRYSLKGGKGISGFTYPEDVLDLGEEAPAKKEDERRIVDEKGSLVDGEYFKEEEAKKKPRADLRKRFLNELTGERGPFTWSDFGVEFTQRWDEVSLEMVMECFDRAMEAEE